MDGKGIGNVLEVSRTQELNLVSAGKGQVGGIGSLLRWYDALLEIQVGQSTHFPRGRQHRKLFEKPAASLRGARVSEFCLVKDGVRDDHRKTRVVPTPPCARDLLSRACHEIARRFRQQIAGYGRLYNVGLSISGSHDVLMMQGIQTARRRRLAGTLAPPACPTVGASKR